MLIKIINNAFANIMLIYSSHNLKNEFFVKTLYLVFVFKTDSVKEGRPQLFHTKFSLIFNITIITNNNKINDIFKFNNIVFFKFNLLSTVVKIKIWVCTSL